MPGLIIVESPTKAKTISKFLDDKFLVKSSWGHVRDLPERELGVDLKNNFKPYYVIIPQRKGNLEEIKQALGKVKSVYLATDPDREGEAIAWHITEALKIENALRIEFHEITSTAVKESFKKARSLNLNLVNAQQARRILDRLVGYKISPLLWRKVKGVKNALSAGRVQSVAVRLLVEREREIKSFKPQEYWLIYAQLSPQRELKPEEIKEFKAKLIKKQDKKIKIENKETADMIVSDLKDADYLVQKITEKEQEKNPPPPFITSTLQQEANRRLGLSATKTMLIAQQLYEGIELGKEGPVGLITYHRTDSYNISKDALSEAKSYIKEKFGQKFLSESKKKHKAPKGAQQAHEAIRPTSVYREPDKIKNFLNNEQLRLYQLIHSRFLAHLMAPANILIIEVEISAGEYLFQARGTKILFPGFLTLYQEIKEKEEEEEEDKVLLPALSEGERLRLIELISQQKWTKPPPRYTEASLVKTLEEKGIGRPSTYAPTIETIKKRGYVKREGRFLKPTNLGEVVTDLLVENFPDVLDVQFTAEMEKKLDLVEEGKVEWVRVLQEFYPSFSKTLKTAEEKLSAVRVEPEVTNITCDRCGQKMVERTGRYGKFLACSGFPSCRNIKRRYETNIKCPLPDCNGYLIKRINKQKRVFYGCTNYPRCKYITFKLPDFSDRNRG